MSDQEEEAAVDFERCFATAPDAVVVHDVSKRVLYWNQTAEVIYGWSFDEMRGRSLDPILFPDEATWESSIESLIRGGVWRGELKQMKRSGELIWVRWHQRLQLDAKGNPEVIVVFVSDITQERALKEEAAEAHRVQSSELLASGIAHELNNALAPILLSSAILQQLVPDEKTQSMASMIERGAKKGTAVVNELLEFERGASRGGLQIRAADMQRTVKRAVERNLPAAISSTIEIEDAPWHCRGDVVAIERLLEALVLNSLEAMPSGGQLSVITENRMYGGRAYVCWIVQDTGCGIEADVLPRVAEPYFSTKQAVGHDGCGLARAQAIALGHGGLITVKSVLGEGTSVCFYLPAKKPTLVSDVVENLPAPTFCGDGQRILIVDTELFFRETMKIALEDAGFRVLLAKDSREALSLYREQSTEIDLVISQLKLPEMDGLALRRAILDETPEANVLISSGDVGPHAQEAVAHCGDEHFLQKPYTCVELLGRVRDLLYP